MIPFLRLSIFISFTLAASIVWPHRHVDHDRRLNSTFEICSRRAISPRLGNNGLYIEAARETDTSAPLAVHTDNDTPGPRAHVHARTGAILLELGTGMVNVGSESHDQLYDKVYRALQGICPMGGGNACLPAPATFEVWVKKRIRADRRPTKRIRETMTVSVTRAWWNGDEKIYRLLVGAVAGAFERGTYDKANCYYFTEHRGNQEIKHRHCNSVDYVAVHFPGGYHMMVHFRGSSLTGVMDCERVVGHAAGYIDILQPEIEAAIGDGDLYVDARCLW